MDKLKFNSKVIVRSPRFPYDIKLNNCWEELKILIKESSPQFYERICNLSFEQLLDADQRLQETVAKYFNRSKYRSTPYGSFASVGITNLTFKSVSLQMGEQALLHKFVSWKYGTKEVAFNQKECISGKLKFFTNTTFYRVAEEIRFIKREDRSFHISAIDYDPEIEQVLLFCCRQRTFFEIREYLKVFNEKELFQLIKDLASINLLTTSLHRNIIGEDHFQRNAREDSSKIPTYIIAERPVLSEGLDAKVFKHLPDLALKMQQLNGTPNSELLERFKADFNRKFEGLEIPIMMALDPETGIGYGDFAFRGKSELLEKVLLKKQNGSPFNPDSDFVKVIIEAIRKNEVIDLEKIHVIKSNDLSLPNTIGVLCTQIDDKLYLDSLGGVTENALSGRFGFASAEILEYCREIANLETTSNPDVLFFDIGYSHEDDVDDINRRPSIYPLQLNILNYDTSLRPLCINDIVVSVRNSNIILRSISLNRRLVPRAASAYNYGRSDLSLFRFLMDIQGQGLCTNLLWRPRNIIPGLNFYPRVEFRNVIVSPASWLLDANIIKGCRLRDQELEILNQFLDSNIPETYFKIGDADQTLLLDKRCLEDIGLLLSQLKKVKSLYLEEAELPKEKSAIDFNDAPVLPQYNLTLQHRDMIYNKIIFKNTEDQKPEVKQWVGPGSNWLYFEIYGEPYRLQTTLEQKLKPFLEANQDKIEKWFFIRYNDGGEHIRLRIRLFQGKDTVGILSGINNQLQPELINGLISNIDLKTYKKEIHRYSTLLIDQVEQHFNEDSNFILAAEINKMSELQKCRFCLKTMQLIKDSGIFSGVEFISIIKKISSSFTDEFEIAKAGFKEINSLHRSMLQEPVVFVRKPTLALYNKFIGSFIELIQLADIQNKAVLFADLFHMHINRLFINNQRFMEMLIYHFAQIECTRELYQVKNCNISIRA